MDVEKLKQTIQELSRSPWFYAAICVVVAILLWYLIASNNRKKLIQQNEDNQIRLNSLKSVPLPFKVARSLALARVNKDIDETVRTCSGNYDTVQTNFKKIQEMISDSDEFMQVRKYKDAKINNTEIDKILNETEDLVGSLEKTLDGILDEEKVQRQKILDLKDGFRSIKMKINDSPDKYLFCWEALDQMVNVIEHKFSEFETIMASNELDKATDKINDIKGSIAELNDAVESIPGLISVSKVEVPTMIEDVQNVYADIRKRGAYLNHLEVEKNLEMINSSLQEDWKKIKQCDTEGVNEHLLECEKRLTQLKQQIEKENSSFDDLMSLKQTTVKNLSQLNATVDKLSGNYDEMTRRYGLSDFSNTLQEAVDRVKELNERSHEVMNIINENNTPASSQLLDLSRLNTDVVVNLTSVNKMADAVNSATGDEKNARDQLMKLSIVLNEVQSKIRTSRLPNISNQYNDDVVKAEDYIRRLEEQLRIIPINVNLVNSLKNNAVDIVYQLYENVNRILGTAVMAENAIVIGNMYRSSSFDIDSELTRAELSYRNGEYTQALTIALNTIKKVHPDSVNKLLDPGRVEAA